MSSVEIHSQRTDVKESFPLVSLSDVLAVSFHFTVPVSRNEQDYEYQVHSFIEMYNGE